MERRRGIHPMLALGLVVAVFGLASHYGIIDRITGGGTKINGTLVGPGATAIVQPLPTDTLMAIQGIPSPSATPNCQTITLEQALAMGINCPNPVLTPTPGISTAGPNLNDVLATQGTQVNGNPFGGDLQLPQP